MQAEVALADDRDAEAEAELYIAFALGCQLGDPCWEGLAARGLANVAARAGDYGTALRTARDARVRCVRHPDRYVSVEAWVLAAVVGIAEAAGAPAAGTCEQLHTLARRTEQPFFQTVDATTSAVPLGRYAVR